MNFLNKLERKYGRYAIQNLPMIMVVLYVVGYVIDLFFPSALSLFQLEPYYILHGQVWRLVTWILIPPSSLDIFTIIMLLFLFFSIGQTLWSETWGQHSSFDLYIFSGTDLSPLIGAFILYGALYAYDRKPGTSGSECCFTHVLYQHVDLPGICPDVPGYAGDAVFPDPDPDEMDGTRSTAS